MSTLRSGVCTLLLAAGGTAFAQGFALEGAVIDSRTSQNLGVVSERGQLDTLFSAQKAMTFGILRSAGISLEQLPPDVRARIERFQTTNLEAFRAFSQGLSLKDEGKFVEAKEQFRRAAELDPGFALATEQQQAMPDVNLTAGLQARAVIAAAAGAAVDRGKATFAVDAARATAALAAGASVITVPLTNEQARPLNADFTTNPPGSGGRFAPHLVAGLSYSYTAAGNFGVTIANVNEWAGDKYRVNGDILESVGGAGDFQAQRGGAALANRAAIVLGDGSSAYWGSWNSSAGASASVTVSGALVSAPTLGGVDYVFGDATRQMPTSGTAVFMPAGGMLANPSGTIAVNFVTRAVAVQNLGFTIGGLVFSGLNGSATYSDRIASGAFGGNYASGNCAGCSGFVPQSSAFNGNFVGREANGLVFSTILLTGQNSVSAGVQLFKQP